MNNMVRNSIFIGLSFLFYLLWSNGGDRVYGKIVVAGIDKVTTNFSSMQNATMKQLEDKSNYMVFCKYADRTTRISLEYCLPIVLLIAWNCSLFFDKRLQFKKAMKLFGFNFLLVYFLQIIFPLLLFNISASKIKSMSLFIGLQVFGFLVFFLILKDSLLLKYFLPSKQDNQKYAKSVK